MKTEPTFEQVAARAFELLVENDDCNIDLNISGESCKGMSCTWCKTLQSFALAYAELWPTPEPLTTFAGLAVGDVILKISELDTEIEIVGVLRMNKGVEEIAMWDSNCGYTYDDNFNASNYTLIRRAGEVKKTHDNCCHHCQVLAKENPCSHWAAIE
jgi:hypothetical protein